MKEIKTKIHQAPLWFTRLFVLLSGWIVLGAVIDGFAHNNLALTNEGFFTPWHGVYYSGLAAATASLVYLLWKYRRRTSSWKQWVPLEYKYSLYGSIIVGLGGAGDFFWHILFGVENSIEALLSPTHLILALGGAMIISAPLRSVWIRPRDEIHKFLVVVAFAILFINITFMVQFLHPYYLPWLTPDFLSMNPSINPEILQGIGVANVVIYTFIFMTMFLCFVKKFKFPFGSFTLILGMEALAITFMQSDYFYFILSALISGFVLDFLYVNLKDSLRETRFIRLLGFLFPFVVTGVYCLTAIAVEGTWWKIHLWLGSVFMSGIVGYLLTFLIHPPSWE